MPLPRVTQPVKRVVFMGSPAFAVPSLRAVAKEFEVIAVYCQPPRPAGRGQKLQPTQVQLAAEELGLPVRHPERLRGEALDALMATPADALCVVAYGLLLPKVLVDTRVCLNVHPSALPRWRGAAPLQHTLMAGDADTEVCIMQLDEGMDTGPVLARVPLAIDGETRLRELHDVTSDIGAAALVGVLNDLHALTPMPQEGAATLAPKLGTADRLIDWQRSAKNVHDRVRGLSPAPGAFFMFSGEQVKVLRAKLVDGNGAPGTVLRADATGIVVACGAGALLLQEIVRPGKKAMAAGEALHGWNVTAGTVLA